MKFREKLAHYKQNRRQYAIALAAISYLAVKFINAFISLISFPLTMNYLGKEKYGLWMAVMSLVNWIHLSDCGLLGGISNALAESNGREQKDLASSYVTTTLVITSVVAVIGTVFSLWVAPYIPWGRLFNFTDPSLILLAEQCFMVLAGCFFIMIPLSVINRIYLAYQKGHIAQSFSFMASGTNLIFLLMAISQKASMPWLVFWFSAGPLLAYIVLWCYLPFSLPYCVPRFKNLNKEAFGRISQSSVPLFIFKMGELVASQLVNIVLAHTGGLLLVADYGIMMKVYQVITSIGLGVATPFYPAIREAFEKQDTKWIKRSIKQVLFIRIGTCIIGAAPFLVAGNALLFIWLKQTLSYSMSSFGWPHFLLTLIWGTITATFSEILLALDEIWGQVGLAFFTALVVNGTSYVLTPYWHIEGIFFAMNLAASVTAIWGGHKIYVKCYRDVTYSRKI